MDRNRIIRLIGGVIVLVGLILAQFLNENFIYLAYFIGIMFTFSGLSGFCVMEMILKKLNIGK